MTGYWTIVVTRLLVLVYCYYQPAPLTQVTLSIRQLLLSAYDYMSISHYYNTRKQQVQRQNDETITSYS